MRTLKMLAGVAALTLAAGVAHAGLVNPSFESGTTGGDVYGWNENDSIPGWFFGPGGDGYGAAAVSAGSYAGMDGANYAKEQFGSLQTAAMDRVAVTPGQTVSLTVAFMAGAGTWDDTLFYVDYYNDQTSWNYTALASSGAMHLPNSAWGGTYASEFHDFSWDVTVPEGVSYMGLRFQAPKIWQGPAYIDNVRASVPEPASLGLLALASLGLMRRRHA